MGRARLCAPRSAPQARREDGRLARGRLGPTPDFPREHGPQIASAHPLERLNREIKRRSDVVGIVPNDAAAVRLIGALMLEARDEGAVTRRHMSPEALARVAHNDPVSPPTTAA